MGEGSTAPDALLEDLKRFSAIREAKKTLTWLGIHLASNGIPTDNPVLAKLREAYAALLELERAKVRP